MSHPLRPGVNVATATFRSPGQPLFRLAIIAALGVITVEATIVIVNHSLNLFPACFGDTAVVAFFAGAPFLAIYLLYLLARTGGDMCRVLLGDARA